jgi:transposase
LAEIEQDLDGAVRESSIWRAKEELLRSVPGIDQVSARTLLAELPELGCSPVVRPLPWLSKGPMNHDVTALTATLLLSTDSV